MTNRAGLKPFSLNEIANPYLEYDMIIKYTAIPRLVDYRARLLYSFLCLGSPVEMEHRDVITLATSLVQIGMDIHDGIDEHDQSVFNQVSVQERKRQLRILAGDYYSAKFYQLLSNIGQLQLVQALTKAICEVNRMKLDYYLANQKASLSRTNQIEAQVQIRKQLFLVFDAILDEAYKPTYAIILDRLTRCEVLVEWIQECANKDMDREELFALFNTEWIQLSNQVSTEPLASMQHEIEQIGLHMQQMITN